MIDLLGNSETGSMSLSVMRILYAGFGTGSKSLDNGNANVGPCPINAILGQKIRAKPPHERR